MSNTPSPKEIAVRWFNEVWNQRRTDLIPELMVADAKGHLEGGQEIVGPDQFIAFQKAIFDVLPDIHLDVLNSLSDGDDACVLWLARGTHTGEGMGLAPTGKAVTFRGVTWFHIVDGKLTEGWDCWNQGELFATLAAKG